MPSLHHPLCLPNTHSVASRFRQPLPLSQSAHVLSLRCRGGQSKAGYRGVWGSDPPRPGTVQQHTVKSISYHQGGSSRRAKGAQPFATIELEVRDS